MIAAASSWSRRAWMRLDGHVDADVIVVGAGLAGLAATAELAHAGRRVLLLDQEPTLGGQAFWSFGGVFLVDSPEQRRLGTGMATNLAALASDFALFVFGKHFGRLPVCQRCGN